jgi:hypothetical protein
LRDERRPYSVSDLSDFRRGIEQNEFPAKPVVDLVQNILENLVDGYDRDFISVASDRVDTRTPRGPCRRGINKEVKKENAFG